MRKKVYDRRRVKCVKVVQLKKLDGVGPVDNRPSPKKLHHFERRKIYIYIYIYT